MTEWPPFFPESTPVAALPHWKSPQLFIPAETPGERWQRSSFYPAFRFSARLFRVALRAWTASGLLLKTRQTPTEGWPLGEFIRETLPEAASVSVLVGTPGPTQKMIAQIWNRADDVIAYLKYSKKPVAQKRLRQEYRVLSQLPTHGAPRPLKFDDWQEGKALVLTPVEGELLTGSLPPPQDLPPSCYYPVRSQTSRIEEHPWIQDRLPPRLRNDVCGALGDRKWAVVVQHGDLTPWNIRRSSTGTLNPFDWEYANLQGFPFVDLAYYILQVGFLIYDWSPERAAHYSVSYLTDHPFTQLSDDEARAVTRMAAYDGYRHTEEDGHQLERKLQQWRRKIWN